MTDPAPDSQRIAELEREVAELRQRLGDGDGPAGGEPGGPAGAAPPLQRQSSVARMVVIGSLVALVALAVMFGIFQALSAGFDSVSRKAAGAFVPDDDRGAATEAEQTPAPAPRQPEPAPRAPGL